MTTITAHKPARTERSRMTGKVFHWPARTLVFECDADGRWVAVVDGERHPVTEEDVIADCRGATNWSEIRAANFRMDGFHS